MPIQRSAYHGYRVVTFVQGLEHPWSIAFLPGGDMLVTEQPGRLRIVRWGKLLEANVPGVPEVHYKGQGGLLDVVPHPDFAENRLLYLSFSKPYADGDGASTAVVRGRNYGWPVIGYGVNYDTGLAIHGGTHRAGMEQPVHVWVPSTGVSGLMLYNGNRFPRWRGSLFAGGLSREQIARLMLEGQKVVIEETLLPRMGRVRDVRQGPDGYIYVAIDGNKKGDKTPIYRLEPADEES